MFLPQGAILRVCVGPRAALWQLGPMFVNTTRDRGARARIWESHRGNSARKEGAVRGKADAKNGTQERTRTSTPYGTGF